MVEIRYGEHRETVELTGRSIAQVREQYKEEFGIPDRAKASLNGKGIGRKDEPRTALAYNDSLSFAQKSRRGLFFIGTILLALAITGGVFAYGATTATLSLAVTNQADFAAVTAGAGATWDAFGSYRGSVGTGSLFTVDPDDNWNGDVAVIVTIANAQDLVEAYRILVLEIEVQDSLSNTIAGPEYLTLGRGEVDLEVTYDSDEPWTVELTGGYYISQHGGWAAGGEDPTLMCQVLQRSAP